MYDFEPINQWIDAIKMFSKPSSYFLIIMSKVKFYPSCSSWAYQGELTSQWHLQIQRQWKRKNYLKGDSSEGQKNILSAYEMPVNL